MSSSTTKEAPSTAAEFIFNSIIQQRRAASEKSNSELEVVPTTVVKESTAAVLNDKNMIPPTEPSAGELIETRPSLKRERADTSGSNRSTLLSMDLGFIKSEDLQLDGGLQGDQQSLKSSDFFKELIVPPSNSAETAPVRNTSYEYVPLKSEERSDKLCPLVELTSKLERITTGDEVIPLDRDIRISSSEWVKDFAAETESGLGAMSPSMFKNPPPVATFETPPPVTTSMPPVTTSMPPLPTSVPLLPTSTPPLATLTPPVSKQTSSVARGSYEEFNVPLRQSSSGTTSKSQTNTSTTTKKRRRKKKKRLIDESRVFEPTDNDVLFGRGGFTNTHPGNIKFREKALELRPWYESVSKEEKYNISDLLVEHVRAAGNRFLEKGSDGLWHEVEGSGARKKASQALRERVRGKRISSANRNKDNGISSSIKSNGSNAADTSGEGLVGCVHPTEVLGV